MFVMLSHGKRVKFYANYRSHDKYYKNLTSMANITKKIYFIMSFRIVTFCKAHSSIALLYMQQSQHRILFRKKQSKLRQL